MATLSEMRRILSPIYAHYTDAVISIIGHNPPPAALEAAKARDLHETEAAVAYHFRFPPECTDCSGKHVKLINKRRTIDVKWIHRPMRPIPRKRPSVEIIEKNHLLHDELLIRVGNKCIGNAMVMYKSKNECMTVNWLQQQTYKLTAREARKYEGWKNSFMEELEKMARKKGVEKIRFSTGYRHVTGNLVSQFIHPEILETYGRLPLQHGYQLAPENPHTLWWEKKLVK